MDKKSLVEHLPVVDKLGAAVVKTGEVNEVSKIKGHYHVTSMGPIEAHRARYIELRDAKWDAERAGNEAEVDRLQQMIMQEIVFEKKWEDVICNVVTTVGGNEMLDKYLAGSTYTAAVVMGLKGTGTAVIADTMGSHASWSEVGGTNAPAYTGNRPTPSFSSASSKSKTTSSAVNFAFTSGGTVAGCFITQGGSATKDNTTGVLFSAGDFTGGSKTVANGDQLNVTYTASV